jgi:hypothetical protein
MGFLSLPDPPRDEDLTSDQRFATVALGRKPRGSRGKLGRGTSRRGKPADTRSTTERERPCLI